MLDPKDYQGSWISGTLKPDELLPKYLEILDHMKEDLSFSYEKGKEVETAQVIGTLDSRMGEIERSMQTDGYWDEDYLRDIDWCAERINELAPDGLYFGAHHGDGADFGFWPVEK